MSAEEVDGKTVVTYDLNPDAVFNDGTAFDWHVFENTWKMSNGENPDVSINATDGYDLIESVTAGESDKQVVVTFKQPYRGGRPCFRCRCTRRWRTPKRSTRAI